MVSDELIPDGALGLLRTASCRCAFSCFRCEKGYSKPSPPPSPVVPLPPWSVFSPPVVPLSVSGVVSGVVPSPNRAEAFFSVAPRLMVLALNSPVPRARRRKPSMFLAMVNSFSEAAPSLLRMPMEKMARSSIFTAKPCKVSSLTRISPLQRKVLTH